MTNEEIRRTIVGRMATFQGLPQDRIVYPNQPGIYSPPPGLKGYADESGAPYVNAAGARYVSNDPDPGLWCRLNINPAPAFMAGMADRPYTRKPGLIVIQCFGRIRSGVRALSELADALEAHFAYWSNGDLECLEASHIDVGGSESVGNPAGTGFYQMNVVVSYRAG